jgi:outer membrane lipopolysaccharide assembly protein LptE/RlpB
MLKRYCSLIAVFMLFVAGCGYTTHSLLPSNYKTIYVDSFGNKIKVTAEQSNIRMYRGYRPGLEGDITKATIDRFLFDGNLRIAPENTANLILKGELIDFRKEPLRYDANDNIEEYRLVLTVNMELIDPATDKVVWKENSFSGETTYTTGGSLAKDESTAVVDGVNDLARRIVERTIEAW